MGKRKASKKDKSSQLVIRIAKSDRAAFIALCEALDTTAAREIRRFMREFVAANATQADAAVAAVEMEGLRHVLPASEEPAQSEDATASETVAETVTTDAPKMARKRVKS